MEGCDARVTTVTVGDKLHQQWAIALRHPFPGILHCMAGSNDVHTVDLWL